MKIEGSRAEYPLNRKGKSIHKPHKCCVFFFYLKFLHKNWGQRNAPAISSIKLHIASKPMKDKDSQVRRGTTQKFEEQWMRSPLKGPSKDICKCSLTSKNDGSRWSAKDVEDIMTNELKLLP